MISSLFNLSSGAFKIETVTALVSSIVLSATGTVADIPGLQYGALGVLAIALFLGYKTLVKINDDCHAHSANREERLVAIVENNADHLDKIMVEVISALREHGKTSKCVYLKTEGD